MIRVGVQVQPQHADFDGMRRAWREAEEMGADVVYTWDHFYPLYGDPDGAHFEGWSLLAAMAVTTTQARFGMLVTCNSYRNPELLADMARTVDHLSGGRHILGIGAGWFERDYQEYGYEFGTGPSRLRDLETSLQRIKARLGKLDPAPLGPLPIMIGGGGEKVTLRLVAEHAQMWNAFGPPERYAAKSRILDEWCEKVGRNPSEVERTVGLMNEAELDQVEEYLDAGATHVILGRSHPFDLDPVELLLSMARE